MRPLVLVVGVIVLLTGVVWALQGAYVLPASFMRGELWVGIGLAVAAAGSVLAWMGIRPARASRSSSTGHE